MKLRWTVDALNDRIAIFDYIAAHDATAAQRIDQHFEERAEQLPLLPHLGRRGLIEGTRELTVHPSYRLVYEIKDETILILNVIHARRNWP